jgi:hypothetical protein
MRNCWSICRYTIPIMVISTKKGALHSFFAEGAKHFHLWAVTNMFQGDTWILAVLDPAIVGIDLTTDMKRSLITENYGVQKSLVLYLMKHFHIHNYPR